MPIFRKNHERPGVSAQRLIEIAKELDYKSTYTDNRTLFIHPEDVETFFKPKHVSELLGACHWYNTDDENFFCQHMRLILCTLVSMHDQDWKDFKTRFIHQGNGLRHLRCNDKNLPISLNDLSRILPDAHVARRFYDHQHQFAPVIISQHTHRRYNADRRLPIIERETLRDASGAQGIVDMVTIPKKFLLYANDKVNQKASPLF